MKLREIRLYTRFNVYYFQNTHQIKILKFTHYIYNNQYFDLVGTLKILYIQI